MSPTVPDDLLKEFLARAKDELDTLSFFRGENELRDPILPTPTRVLDLTREILLQKQKECLAKILDEHNSRLQLSSEHISLDHFQSHLKAVAANPTTPVGLRREIENMNDSARIAFARLVLESEFRMETERTLRDQMMKLKVNEKGLSREDIVEFCGLLRAAVKMKEVKEYLVSKEGDLFQQQNMTINLGPNAMFSTPPKKWERIQHMYLHALGHDAAFALPQINRMFRDQEQLKRDDPHLHEVIAQTFSTIQNNLNDIESNSFGAMLSDHKEGGFTRIVSVHHSEHSLDRGGETYGQRSLPQSQYIRNVNESQTFNQLKVASQAAKLQESLLCEMKEMPEEERNRLLERASKASEEAAREILKLEPGIDRVNFLTSLDADTQRLLAIHRLQNGIKK